jgi:hypothetical protein
VAELIEREEQIDQTFGGLFPHTKVPRRMQIREVTLSET